MYKAIITFQLDEGDGVWREPVASGDVTRVQVINDAILVLLGVTFGERADWYEQQPALWQASGTEDQLLAEVTVFTAEYQALIISTAARVFHHTVVRLQEFNALKG